MKVYKINMSVLALNQIDAGLQYSKLITAMREYNKQFTDENDMLRLNHVDQPQYSEFTYQNELDIK